MPARPGDNSDFTNEQLQRIAEGKDVHIDDPELFTTKRELMDKFTPLSTTNAIQSKHKDICISRKDSVRKNPENQMTMLYSFYITISTLNIQGHAEEATKKLAQHKACQQFLKNLFPKGTTWNDAIDIVQN